MLSAPCCQQVMNKRSQACKDKTWQKGESDHEAFAASPILFKERPQNGILSVLIRNSTWQWHSLSAMTAVANPERQRLQKQF